ncbi:acyclic terpene utilization AtuA family protein [Enterococcus canintestini]|uniref:acyclic terpene utilization AtuA family protein n=1 Tax=Enterococcus canintestini TaxID=317010 RepID=UPI00288CC43C|nr:acyclic terpene utilization AtuA family protein [Enterococcus canintestini]MDT2739793.1 acyclic terpene utilization AtuA family protein [Enterococcus canintestini]
MESVKVFVPYGAVGLNCTEESFEAGLLLKPDIISSDAGSTDSGPYYLGSGHGKYAIKDVKRDLKRMVLGADKLKIPMTIGTAGTCGSDEGVDTVYELIVEICKEAGIHKKIAKIYSQQDREIIKQKYRTGQIQALHGAPAITEETFDECDTIVALLGSEPYEEAFKNGADIIIGGRSTDTAVIAAYPLLKGCDPAACWHAAKTVECGGVCTSAGLQGGVFMEVDDKGFTIRAVQPGSTVSPYSVSAHLLYENANPVQLTEPGIRIDTKDAKYSALSETAVRVEGTTIEYLPYTMKLEGSGVAGFQTVSMAGIRDRKIMKEPMQWIDAVAKAGVEKLEKAGISKDSYDFWLRPYGYNGVSGMAVPENYVPNEILMMLTVTAATQELATQIAKAFNPLLLHYNMFEGKQMPSFGFIFSPAEMERGAIYEFKLYHTVSLDDPNELCRIAYATI